MTVEQEGAEGVEDTEVIDGAEGAEGTEGAEGGEEQAPSPSVEDIAARMGWVPKEKFRGDEAKWKPADQFIIDGREIQDRTSSELKSLRTQIDTMAKTSAAIMADKLREQHEQLAAKYQAAVEKGDPDEAFKLGRAIDSVVQRREQVERPAPSSQPVPEADQWVSRNAWFDPRSRDFDPVAHDRAQAICASYAKANVPHAEQLQKTEAIIRREFPHLFDSKGPAEVNGATTRSTAAPAKRGASYADLPKPAKELADDLVDRGLISDKETYAKNYFAELAKKESK